VQQALFKLGQQWQLNADSFMPEISKVSVLFDRIL
jgi:hypothetical protein